MSELEGDDFLRLDTLSRDAVDVLLDETRKVKNGSAPRSLDDATLGMIFQKRSTRTRVSFEAGMNQLGGSAVFLSEDDIQLGRGETVADTARALSRYVDVLMARVYEHSDIEELAQHADVPVINGLSDFNHPCQALADVFTVTEVKSRDVRIAWVGDGNNVCHSLLHACSMTGIDITVATPEKFEPDAGVVENAEEFADGSGSTVEVTNDPVEAVADADVVYTDSWVSMGDGDKDVEAFEGFQVNAELVSHAADDYVFMHCLPAHRGREVTDEVMDSDHSVVWRQAENRLHAQKALLTLLVPQVPQD